MSKAIRELCYERNKINEELREVDAKLEAAQKEHDRLKAKLDLRDEMLCKLIEEETEEDNSPKVTAEVLGKCVYTKDGMKVVVVGTGNNYKLVLVAGENGVRMLLTPEDIDWDRKH